MTSGGSSGEPRNSTAADRNLLAPASPVRSRRRSKSIRVLVVCRWPVGGIRSYLLYTYDELDPDNVQATVLATPVKDPLISDPRGLETGMAARGILVRWGPRILGREMLWMWVLLEMFRRRHHVIHSQGFGAAAHSLPAQLLFRAGHVVTVHGVVERRFVSGRASGLRRWLIGRLLRIPTILHAVSNDILSHVRQQLPVLSGARRTLRVIRHGIDVRLFQGDHREAASRLRHSLPLPPGAFVFGFFGRFMAEKGFGLIVEAVDALRRIERAPSPFVVVSWGSGEQRWRHEAEVKKRGLSGQFIFLPSTPRPWEAIQACDSVLMPSLWEAYGLLACEVLCSGVPLIAARCMGLREAVYDTPTLTFTPGEAQELAAAMKSTLEDRGCRERFRQFRSTACVRYDVSKAREGTLLLLRAAGRRRSDDAVRRSRVET